ncbi:MAG TPA: hypothetical protein VK877_09600, partial [Pseudolabrys sp.]|nr:hypothetical protein [Pseudolabrys sp.]
MARILAVAETRDGSLRKVSDEVVSAARSVAESIGGEVDALVFGPAGVSTHAGALGKFGAARVLIGESDALQFYSPDVAAQLVADTANSGDYFAVLFAASSTGKDLAPRVAAKLDVPLAADATALQHDGGEL